MKKESIKTFILSLLIINCIILTCQIWLNEKLWPSGYNFFGYAKNLPVIGKVVSVFDNSQTDGKFYTSVTMPNKIVISGTGAREVYYSNDKMFSDVMDFLTPIIENIYSSQQSVTVIDKEIWESNLKSESIYVDFGFETDTYNMGKIFNIKNPNTKDYFSKTSKLIISSEPVVNLTNIYAYDSKTNEYKKITTTLKGNDLRKYVESLTASKFQNHSFAFELNLDKNSEQAGITHKVILDSILLLPVDTININAISIQNVFSNNNNLSQVSDRIITAFGYQPSLLRKSVNQDGVVSYVENGATVKISPNGVIEYNAVTADKGISLSDTKLTYASITSTIISIAKDVSQKAGIDNMLPLKLQSELSEDISSSFTVVLDYYVNGIPIIIDFDKSGYHTNAISAKIENGYIKNFRINLMDISQNDEISAVNPVLETLDKFCETLPEDAIDIKIENISECYYVTNFGNINASRCVKYNDKYIVP